MRLHSDILTTTDLYRATPAGVHVDRCDLHGSRKRMRAYDCTLVVLEGGRGTAHPYRRNGGQYGANGDGYAATYDEWGEWLAALYEIDPTLIAGPYEGYDDFHRQTDRRYPAMVGDGGAFDAKRGKHEVGES